MSYSKSRFLAGTSGHTEALISYVLDAKPYHVKLSEIVERYQIEDAFHVNIEEEERKLIFLGANIYQTPYSPAHAFRSKSWVQELSSDGGRTQWQTPMVSVHKFLSKSNQEKFVAGTHDNNMIPGFAAHPAVAFSPKRWDGPSVTNVRKQGYHQQESFDYFLSHGAYTFSTSSGSTWKEYNVRDVAAMGPRVGDLFYAPSVRSFGTIENIVGGDFDEWTLECTNESPQTISVVGQRHGFIGTVELGQRFTHALISFDFTVPGGRIDPLLPLDSQNMISLGDKFTITPFNKITVAPDAPEEVWSIIKTNPIVITAPGVFTSASTPEALARTFTPALELHTRSLDRHDELSTWVVTFNGDGTYDVRKTSVSESYVYENVALADGCSFKNKDVHFTIIPTIEGFVAGDTFSFTLNDRVENFIVFGSVSGWTANAKQGEWYWNGKIGFKVPKLEYFSEVFTSAIFSSPDAEFDNWLPAAIGDSAIKDIMYNDGFYALTDVNEVIFSKNGNYWSSLLPFRATLERMLFVTNRGKIFHSMDGVHWDEVTSGVFNDLKAHITLLDTNTSILKSIAVGNGGMVLYSNNGTTWTQGPITTKNLTSIATDGQNIFVCGADGYLAMTPDFGATWSELAISAAVLGGLVQSTINFNDIKYIASANKFILVGSRGTIFTSTDGINWIRPPFNWDGLDRNIGTFSSIIEGGNGLIAVGPDGYVARADANGNVWYRNVDTKFKKIIYGGGLYVTLGATPPPANLFVEVKPIHSMAEPSVYTIRFREPTVPGGPVQYATVVNNLYGYRKALKVNEVWEDEFCSFKLTAFAGEDTYQAGDTIKVYLAPEYILSTEGWYDIIPYEYPLYDVGAYEIRVPWLYNEEYYPLYHAHGLVVFKDGVVDGDKIIIDKAIKDVVSIKIDGSTIKHPELAPDQDWIPLEFRYFDNIASSSIGYDGKTAHFPDLTTTIEAYLASDPTVRAFTLISPRFKCTGVNASTRIVFDQSFVNKYLPFNTRFTIRTQPDGGFSQKLRVKVTENLKVNVRIRLNFDDVVSISIADLEDLTLITAYLELTDKVKVSFVESGALPFFYDESLYDMHPFEVPVVVMSQTIEQPGGDYEWTGNDEDFVIPKPTTGTPGTYIGQKSNDVTGAAFIEGLSITSTKVALSPGDTDPDPLVPMGYKVFSQFCDFDVQPVNGFLITDVADKYIITVTEELVTSPTVYVGNDIFPDPNPPFSITPTMTTTYGGRVFANRYSFSFDASDLDASISVPFRLIIIQ